MKTLALGFAWLLGTVSLAAEPELHLSPKKIRDEVRAVVADQLAALREGNFPQAYELASTAIKEQFDEPFFSLMMQRGYAPLFRANETEIGVVRDTGGVLAQVSVNVTDRKQHSIVYLYWLVREEAGWRVDGVTLEQRPPRGDT